MSEEKFYILKSNKDIEEETYSNDYSYEKLWLYSEKYVKEKEQEIERLNNIIDKAVKYIYKNSFDKEEFKCWFRVFNTDLQGYAQKLLDILKEKQ